MEGYIELVNAIIIQAAKDYRAALCRLKENPIDRRALYVRGKIESFFYTEYFNVLTNVDPYMIIERLKAEVNRI